MVEEGSSWLGRYSFSRSVCHRIQARNLPDFRHTLLPKARKSNCSTCSSSASLSDCCSSYSASSSPLPSPELPPAKTKRVESWSKYLEEDNLAVAEEAQECSVDMSQLFVGHKFASGAHSTLYHGIYKGRAVAIKVTRQPQDDEGAARALDRQFHHEVSLLSRLHHPNIVQFVAACKKPPVLCVITEYMSGGSLRAFLHKVEPQSLPLKVVLGMALDIARGMEYIHSKAVVHGDLKSENLVLDQDMTVKITDFGVARLAPAAAASDDVGTYRWMAPEMICHRMYSFKVDVYSFGIVLWELVTGMVPFQQLNAVQAAYAVVHKDARPDIPKSCPTPLSKLMQRCWASSPEERPSFREVVQAVEQFEDASSKAAAYNTWHCPSQRTKYFLSCFSQCNRCAGKCSCK